MRDIFQKSNYFTQSRYVMTTHFIIFRPIWVILVQFLIGAIQKDKQFVTPEIKMIYWHKNESHDIYIYPQWD